MSISWTATKNTATNVVRFETTGVVPVDLFQVVEGDYVNIFGTGFNINNRGSFEITNVEVYYVGATIHQAFEVVNPLGVAGLNTQSLNDDLQFFRPLINGIQAEAGRTVVVSSTVDGQLEVVIPATTQAVNRTVLTGSYLHTNDSLSISRINRNKNGEVTVFYTGVANPVLSVNSSIFIDNINTTPPEYFRSLGVISAWPGTSTTDSSTIDNVNLLQEMPDVEDDARNNFAMIKASNGDGLIIGGHALVASVPTASSRIARFRPVSTAVVSDASLADGANRYTYSWPVDGATNNATELIAIAPITVGPAVNQVMLLGGAELTLANYSTTTAIDSTGSRKYDPVANANTSSGISPAPFVGHTLTTLVDGRILAYGGADCISNTIVGRNANTGYIWNPGTEAWPAPGVNDFATVHRRAHHVAVTLDDSKILFCGGLSGATARDIDIYTLASWALSETAGVTINDQGPNVYNLTTSGVTAPVAGAKLDSGREFTQVAAHATGAGDAAAVTALKGEWTVEWWSCGATGAYPAAMTLSGLGFGTIISYGVVGSELEADNTLMSISITGGGHLKWRWEESAGGEVGGQFLISGHVVDHYNHFAVRKTSSGFGSYNVSLFVNGNLIQTFFSYANATGGANGQWYMARDPDGTTGFTGVIDNVSVSSIARSDADILLAYWEGCASLPTSAGSRSHRIGRLLEYCETFDPLVPIVSSVQPAASMMLGRAYHTGTLLPDGRVIVIGGLAHNTTSFLPDLVAAGPTSLFGPAESTNATEFYDPDTNSWTKGPELHIRRYKHSAVYVSSRNAIFIIGGQSTQGDDCNVIEVLDVNTMRLSTLSEKLTYRCGGAILLDNNTILCGTNAVSAGEYVKIHQLISLESPGISTKGILDIQRITEVGAGYFKFQSAITNYYSNFAKPNNDNIPSYTITFGARTSNVTTLTLASTHTFLTGESVFININNAALFGNGMKTLTAVTTTTISYAETAANQASVAQTGQVFKDFSPDASVTSMTALSDSIPGPYVFDPIEGVSITSIKDTVGGALFAGIYKNQSYTTLPVADASLFPDEEGFIVLGFGTDLQTVPIKYFGRFNADGLLIDFNYKFVNDMPSGTEVVLLSQRDPFVPTELVGSLYATSTSAGRVAAQNTVNEIAAAGIEVNITVVYPGDRGLGGEGYPVIHADKLSDKVVVWGGDDLDNEIKALKE